MRNLKIPTIVLVDSGIGGVAVLNRLIDNYIYANYIYIADNAFMPYGNKSKSEIRSRADKLVEQIILKYCPDYIIIACNTMSTCIKSNHSEKIILMKFKKSKLYLATKLTKKNLKDYKVVADTNLARLIERSITNKSKIRKIINNHLTKKCLKQEKQLVLGCTHYELCKDVFQSFIDGSVKCNSEYLINEIKGKLKKYSTKSELNIVIETTRKSESERRKILVTISKLIFKQ